jgi:hypothetical protein
MRSPPKLKEKSLGGGTAAIMEMDSVIGGGTGM